MFKLVNSRVYKSFTFITVVVKVEAYIRCRSNIYLICVNKKAYI